MTAFAIYNDDGQILRTGSCPESDLHLKADEGEHIFIGYADELRHKIIDGQIVEVDIIKHVDILRQVRLDRNLLLTKSDWTQMADTPLTQDQKQLWAEYRQLLRDLTTNLDGITDLADVPWPTQPE